jgi:meiotically up-regulated gene 157 (Mug157) protein
MHPNPAGAVDRAIPEGLRQLRDEVRRDVAGHPAIATLFDSAFTYTWRAAMRPLPDGGTYVATGDIPAMWLRDSTAQVRPYLLAAQDPAVAAALTGVLRNQVRYVLTDPYANAFKAEPDPAVTNGNDDLPVPGPLVWERKYEVDSLAAVLQLGYGLWRATGRLDHVDGPFLQACRAILDLWAREQDHDLLSPYTFQRIGGPHNRDTLARGGRGGPVAPNGMTWTAFRPSDDRCEYGYLVPGNAMAAVALRGLAEMTSAAGALDVCVRAAGMSAAIAESVRVFGTVGAAAGSVYAYEIDGLGGRLMMDDANAPSLLSLPYLGWCARSDPQYLRTRDMVLSPANPYYYRGRAAAGIGSPHTPPGHVWPLALAMQGLTADDPHERWAMAELIARTDAGTGGVHESFDVNDPATFTRAWFGWGNALFSELVLALTGRRAGALFPSM